MLVFAAIVPHSPLLLPTIGKEHQQKLKKTLTSYKVLSEELYASRPDTIVMLSAHAPILPEAFPLLIASTYCANLKEFGDLTTKAIYPSDMRTIEDLRRLRLNRHNPTPLVGLTEEFLDYASAVPLYFLTPNLPRVRLVTLGTSYLPIARHFEVGRKIAEVLQKTTKRVAVIASADLAHTLTDTAPGGFAPEGKKFDEALIQALRRYKRDKILALETKMDLAKACGLRVIALLLGVIDDLNCTPKPLSYEGPFGVGYLVARFNFR